MEDEQIINFWTTVRWEKVKRTVLILAPIALVVGLVIGILTVPIVRCTDLYPDGTSVTHYGKQCLEPISTEVILKV